MTIVPTLELALQDAPLLLQCSTTIQDLRGDARLTLSRGMNVAAGPKLAAAVSNAGGLGVIGGIG